jgi:nitric oxide reductase NorD protein
VLVLLDLSASTQDTVPGSGDSVLALTRAAAALLADAVQAVGDPFALHGFCSNGRHDVRYYRIKDFAAPLDVQVHARLAGLRGECSTRMGAALRHAGRQLAAQPQRRRLLLLVTDGEPADVDERDPQYLRQDARKAVEELRAQGVQPFCLTLDPRADPYVERIFGATGYAVADRVERLPEKLPALFASLTS